MNVCKNYRIQSGDKNFMSIEIRECLPVIFTWPSSLVLAAFIASYPSIVMNKRILELGSGTGIPSIMAALVGASNVIATERDNEAMLSNLRYCIAMNSASVAVAPLDWHSNTYSFDPVDVILSADILYSSEDFSPVISTMTRLMHSKSVSYAAYQERASSRTLVPHLDVHGLKAEIIPLSSFLHPNHQLVGSTNVTYETAAEASGASLVNQQLHSFDSIFLLKIEKK